MRTIKLPTLFFAALCCLMLTSAARAQNAFGYSSMTFDQSTNTLTGYAWNDMDYETAYYYDAEVQARVEDQYGNVLASGSGFGNPTALTVLDVFQAALCIRYSVISYIYVRPHFLGCGGNQFWDYLGFDDFPGYYYWNYFGFLGSRQSRCIFGQLIFIGAIVSEFISCLPANVACQISSTNLLPSDFRAVEELPYLLGVPNQPSQDNTTITCRATNQFGNPVSRLNIRFGFDNPAVVELVK